jgi:lycopene cyclase domain-containing protein
VSIGRCPGAVAAPLRGIEFPVRHTTYLIYEIAWALPVIAVQWAVARRELWRWRRLLIAAVLVSTLYLGACDAFALGHGIWRVDPARVVGIYAGPLPLEEFVFYFVTNIMAAQGFVMIVGFLRERQATRDNKN